MKSFNEVYEQVHKESFEELEILRKKAKRKLFRSLLIIGIVIVFVVFFFKKANSDYFMSGRQTIFLFYFSAVIVMISIIVITAISKTKYTPTFKEKVIGPFIKNIDKNLQYKPNEGISSVIYRMGEFEGYDNYYTEDLIIGKLDEKYNFQMAEVKTEEESTDSDGDTHTSIVFYGLFGNIECAKNIGTKFKVRSDKGIFGKMFKGKTKVEMDSQEFEKYFDVYGDNKIIVMQILTSEVMSTMIDFIQQSKIKYELTINKDQIYIRFHTGGVFEPSLFKNSLDYSMLKKYYDIIDFVFKVTREINSVIEKVEI